MQHPATRRQFISTGSLGFLGLTLRDYLQAASNKEPFKPRANAVILFWLEGGPSDSDTFDP